MRRSEPLGFGRASSTGGLEGWSILVTGGGTGIGLACSARLLADGAHVTICGRTQATLDVAETKLATVTHHGGSVQSVVADMTEESGAERAIATAVSDEGKLDACVANVGGASGTAPLHLLDAVEFDRVVEINLRATFLTLKHAMPALMAAGAPSFVAISSLASHVTHPYLGAYPPAKAAIDAMVRNAADEYGRHGVRVNGVRPGFTATELMLSVAQPGPIADSYVENTPLDGVGQPEDVAEAVRFLVGVESRWITGHHVDVDGGHGLRRGPDFSSVSV